jgi:ketosteroid isomerase-like protein
MTTFKHVTQRLSILLALGLCHAAGFAQAQAQVSPDLLIQAQTAIVRQEWSKAEALLTPLSEAQPRNPFVFYEMARVYENTNRADAARQIYQGLASIPDANQRQYAMVVRTPEVSYLTSLVSLSQARLNAMGAAAPQVAARAAPTAPALAAPVAAAPIAAQPAKAAAAKPTAATAIGAALQSWATAWANKDVPGYYSHYTNSYQGALRSHAAWQKQRADYIKSKKTISLDISDVQVTTVSETKAQATFKQNYTSDSYSDKTSKTLVFAKVGDAWLIEKELATK